MTRIDIEMERSTKRGAVDPKLDEMMQPRLAPRTETASNLWTGTDPNPALLPREMPYVGPWAPKAFSDKDFAPNVIEVPMRFGDRLHAVMVRACEWLDGLFGAR
jgi:hypothetical protein